MGVMAIRLTARSLLSEPSFSVTRATGESEPPRPGRHLDRHQIAVLRIAAGAGRDRKLAAELLLVDRREPPAAARQRAEDAEHALLGPVDDLDDAAAVADRFVVFAALLDPQQSAVADARDLAGARAARHAHADLRRRAVRLLVPFGRNRDQFAIGVAAADIGEHDLGQGAGMMQLLLALRDAALVGELAQRALELGAVGVLEPEGARDLARADAARLLADEGEDLLLGRMRWLARGAFHEKWFREGCSLGSKLARQ